MMSPDQDTRQRLIAAGARLFAERGFKKVTVRQICKAADANIAAVNYHFRNKLGLYTEVARAAIDVMRMRVEAVMRGQEGRTVRDALQLYIRALLEQLAGQGHESWIHKLMTHEMTDPTPALDLIVEEGIRPRLRDLSKLVSELMQCPVDDERVGRCVASIRGQCLVYLPNPVSSRLILGRQGLTGDQLDQIAAHITEFSMAGICAVGRLGPAHRPQPGARR
jgi:TetR/AcrR family transcriptional regulator, regulator of cefoperazone and chloramphenicol sensitivity